MSPPSVTHAAPSGPTMTPCGAEPSPSGISSSAPSSGRAVPACRCAGPCTRPSRRVRPPRRAGACRRGPVLLDAEAGGGRRGGPPQRSPLLGMTRPTTRKRLFPSGRKTIASPSSSVCPDVSWTTTPCVTRTVSFPARASCRRAARVADLRAPGVVVLGRDRVEERRVDGRAAEREPRRLERPAVRAREDLADGQPEPAHPLPDRARVGASLRGEVPLRRAVGDDDGILVGLREVRGGVPEDDDEPAGSRLRVRSGRRRRTRRRRGSARARRRGLRRASAGTACGSSFAGRPDHGSHRRVPAEARHAPSRCPRQRTFEA